MVKVIIPTRLSLKAAFAALSLTTKTEVHPGLKPLRDFNRQKKKSIFLVGIVGIFNIMFLLFFFF